MMGGTPGKGDKSAIQSKLLFLFYNDGFIFTRKIGENWLINTINEVKSLQYDCYLQLGLLMFMMTSFVARFNFIFMMLCVTILKFGINPMEEA